MQDGRGQLVAVRAVWFGKDQMVGMIPAGGAWAMSPWSELWGALLCIDVAFSVMSFDEFIDLDLYAWGM